METGRTIQVLLVCFVCVVFAAQAAQTTPTALVPAPSDANGKTLRAAAEQFEKLTEIAFSAAWPTLAKRGDDAEKAADGLRRSLPNNIADQLDAQLSTMKTSRQNKDRAGLALSSIEAYRVLVSAVTDKVKVPTEVSLLDYAGFRYDADLKAKPIRWDDMARAVSFAHETWGALSPRAKASPVAVRFEKAVTNMDKAVAQRNKSLAAASVKAELDLVDQLEAFFSSH
ncbi:MAG: hypothetical protein M3167_06420 [Acidobacteriota bacterium]|nr:hypothetical protein [Acidobacteriota bacterium]